MDEGRRSAVIVGAGIGGLATAIGLLRAGWNVRVLERAATPSGIGAGISLWSNALRALEALDVARSIRAHGTLRVGGGVRTPSGRWMSRSFGDDLMDSADVAMLMVHRAELHRELHGALPPDVVVAGATVDLLGQDGRSAWVRYRTGDGSTTVTGDVVVGADGLHSVTGG